MSGEGTAKSIAKLGRATYVTDTGDLPPDPGAMSLVFLTKGMMGGGLARGVEKVWSWTLRPQRVREMVLG